MRFFSLKMRRPFKWLLFLAILGLLVMGARQKMKTPPIAVHLQPVQRVQIQDTVSGVAAGYVEALRRVYVQAETMGRINRIHVRRGDRVKEGDLLVELDGTDLADQIGLLEASRPTLAARVHQAEVRSEQVGNELKRAQALLDSGSLPKQAYDNALYASRLAEADVTAARSAMGQLDAQLQVARSSLRKTKVKAPFDGIVYEVHVEQGDMAGLGGSSAGASGGSSGGASSSTASTGSGGLSASSLLQSALGGSQGKGLLELVDDSELFAYADFDENDYHKIAPGQSARLTFDALGKVEMSGTVLEVYPYISRSADQNRTVRIKVRLEGEAKERARSGMSVHIEVLVGAAQDVLAVPAQYVMTRSGVKVVYILTKDLLEERRVKTGITNWEWVELREGVVEGEKVAVPVEEAKLKDQMPAKSKSEMDVES